MKAPMHETDKELDALLESFASKVGGRLTDTDEIEDIRGDILQIIRTTVVNELRWLQDIGTKSHVPSGKGYMIHWFPDGMWAVIKDRIDLWRSTPTHRSKRVKE